MKFSWKQLDSGLTGVLVIGSEWERSSVPKDVFSRKATMELPRVSPIAAMLTINHARERFMLKLTGSHGPLETGWLWEALKCTLPTSHVRHVPSCLSTQASPESSTTWTTEFVTEWHYSTKH